MSEQNKEGKESNIRQKNGVSSSLRNAPLHSKLECMHAAAEGWVPTHLCGLYTQRHYPQRVCPKGRGAHIRNNNNDSTVG